MIVTEREPTLLLTAFDPFGSEPRNASEDVMRMLDRERFGRVRVVGHLLPTSFDRAVRELDAAIARYAPAFVLAIGQGAPDDPIRIETRYRNFIDARIPDNDGAQPRCEPIDRSGEVERRPRIGAAALATAAVARGIDAIVSEDAGGFVCNALAYHLAAREPPSIFVHVPSYGERDAAARDALATRSAEGLRAIVAAIVTGL